MPHARATTLYDGGERNRCFGFTTGSQDMLRARLLTAAGAALALVTLAGPTSGPAKAQDEPTKKDMGAMREAMKSRMAKGAASKEGSIKPYDDVITSRCQ